MTKEEINNSIRICFEQLECADPKNRSHIIALNNRIAELREMGEEEHAIREQ